jgi:excisionase family DNA binding protein
MENATTRLCSAFSPPWPHSSVGKPLAKFSPHISKRKMPMSTEKSKPPVKLLTVADAALFMNLSTRTVRRLIAKHGLPVIRCGRSVRIHPVDLDRFVAANRFA